MTTIEIIKLFSNTIPENMYELANLLASLDTQTTLEIIEKYNADIKLSQKQLSNEIQTQRINKANEF